MSLGGGGASKLMADSVAYARKKGVVVVCAAGNAGRGIVEYPAAYPGAVAVSSVGPQGNLAPYSSYGKEIDIAAPGGDKSQGETSGILQQTIDPADPSRAVYAYFQGTSMATPHVAGVAALLWSAGAKSPDEVEKALFAGAKARGQAWNNKFGHGLLDAEASLKALKAGTDVTEPERTPAMTPRASTKDSVLKVVLGVLLAIGTAATLRQRNRNPLGPALLVALTLAAAGLFFIPAPESTAMFSGVGIVKKVIAFILSLIEIPIPDWGEWFFGPGKASPLFYSALIPLVASPHWLRGQGHPADHGRPVLRVCVAAGLLGLGGHAGPGVDAPAGHRGAVPAHQCGRVPLLGPRPHPQDGDVMKVKGTVERTDMGAGAFVLKTDDGKQFQLVGADKSIKKAGLKVEIDGDLDSGNTAAMVAPLLRVTGFKIV